MTSRVFDQQFDVDAAHYTSMIASLERRLEVARQRNDQRLIDLLEQERRQLNADNRQGTLVSGAIAWVKNLWQQMTQLINDATALQVWQSNDQQGNRWWFAYDPTTGRSTCTDSESEMRIWIEQNYQGK
jgi:hypothetical protein